MVGNRLRAVRPLPLLSLYGIGVTIGAGIYALVAVAPLDQIGESETPLTLALETATGRSGELIILIAIFAVLNGVMIQLIMSSRILCGIAREVWIPESVFAYVHRRRVPRSSPPRLSPRSSFFSP